MMMVVMMPMMLLMMMMVVTTTVMMSMAMSMAMPIAMSIAMSIAFLHIFGRFMFSMNTLCTGTTIDVFKSKLKLTCQCRGTDLGVRGT